MAGHSRATGFVPTRPGFMVEECGPGSEKLVGRRTEQLRVDRHRRQGRTESPRELVSLEIDASVEEGGSWWWKATDRATLVSTQLFAVR